MIGLLQRVERGEITVGGARVGAIALGLVVLVGVERGDDTATARRLLQRLLGYRVFSDDDGRMNRSLSDVGGGLLLVPQFTLAADTRKGMRPSFTPAAPPADGRKLFDYLVAEARRVHAPVASGQFGADMRVSLVNFGPVTFWLRIAPRPGLGPGQGGGEAPCD